MSLNLLTVYSDDEDSDCSPPKDETVVPTDRKEPELDEKKSYFFNDDDDNSSDDEDKRYNHQPVADLSEPPTKKMLPSARDLFSSNVVKSSVFMNEQQREESVHHARLSQHVPLTEQQKTISFKSKQICKAFRRGECHRGDKCKYTHPPPATPEQLEDATIESKPRMYTSTDEVLNSKPLPVIK